MSVSTGQRERTLSAPAAAIMGQAGPRPVINAPRIRRKPLPRKFTLEEKGITDKKKSRKYEGKRRSQNKNMRWEVGSRFMK